MPPKKLLVADDSLTIQKVIRLALSNEGYQIEAVSDGNDAFQQISVFRPDVVLIDVSLPGKTAFELKRECNQHEDLKDVRFILMSSAFEKVDENQASEVHFQGRLTKPFDPAHLRTVLNEVLSGTPPLLKRGRQDDHEPGILDVKDLKKHMTPPPAPPAGGPAAAGHDDDIKNLTESTMGMAEVEDFQWSVAEPSLKPLPKMVDHGGSSFDLAMDTAPAASDDTARARAHAHHIDAQNVDLIPLDAKEMEAIVRAQAREMIERMVTRILPEVAEKVIKQEIHKMLSEKP